MNAIIHIPDELNDLLDDERDTVQSRFETEGDCPSWRGNELCCDVVVSSPFSPLSSSSSLWMVGWVDGCATEYYPFLPRCRRHRRLLLSHGFVNDAPQHDAAQEAERGAA